MSEQPTCRTCKHWDPPIVTVNPNLPPFTGLCAKVEREFRVVVNSKYIEHDMVSTRHTFGCIHHEPK